MAILEIFMLLVISLIILFAYKPWRYFSCFRNSRFASTFKLRDLQRPLLSDDGQTSEVTREYDLEGDCYQNEELLNLSSTEGRVKLRLPYLFPNPALDASKALFNDGLVGQRAEKGTLAEVQTYESQNNRSQNLQNRLTILSPRHVKDQRIWLSLEVIEGPSSGLQHAVHSKSTSKLPAVTLGRVGFSSDLSLKDPAVSGKHAQIRWNFTNMKWELVDMGSINGTLLNSQSVSHPDSGSRMWGNPVELASGDIITLGTTTKVYVRISSQNEFQAPCRIGVASDPMAARRGGKILPMEDVCLYKWPLPGHNKFGLFCVCDGHGGAGASQTASKFIPEVLASILSDPVRKEKVLSQRDASDVLRDVLAKTEALLKDHLYEGCTATVLLVWKDSEENVFAQCANLGDSACVINLDGGYIQMTEDHRVSSLKERKRFEEAGLPLRDEQARIFGINLARMLGDQFAKEQDIRFIAEPYISEPLRINQSCKDKFAVLASDGLWDVVKPKRVVELVRQMREIEGGLENSAEKIAKVLLDEARDKRTTDNTSIIYLDFDTCL